MQQGEGGLTSIYRPNKQCDQDQGEGGWTRIGNVLVMFFLTMKKSQSAW